MPITVSFRIQGERQGGALPPAGVSCFRFVSTEEPVLHTPLPRGIPHTSGRKAARLLSRFHNSRRELLPGWTDCDIPGTDFFCGWTLSQTIGGRLGRHSLGETQGARKQD